VSLPLIDELIGCGDLPVVRAGRIAITTYQCPDTAAHSGVNPALGLRMPHNAGWHPSRRLSRLFQLHGRLSFLLHVT
jgi:hypothetical protein